MELPQPDPAGQRYARHWEPLLAGPARRLLERVAASPRLRGEVGLPGPAMPGQGVAGLGTPAQGAAGPGIPGPGAAGLTVLDLGAGTGLLALAAAEIWPDARIIGLDASAAMLSVARHRAQERHGGPPRHGDAERQVAAARPARHRSGTFEWLVADAAAIPLDEASTDVVVSSFMLQLAADRTEVLRDVRRVLRPGGLFGFVTWIADELCLDADEAFADVVEELDLDAPGKDPEPEHAGEFESVDEARGALFESGFVDVVAGADEVCHTWTREGFLEFKLAFDELDLVESLLPRQHERLVVALRARLSTLPDEAFELRAPLVYAYAAKGEASSGRQTRQGR